MKYQEPQIELFEINENIICASGITDGTTVTDPTKPEYGDAGGWH